MSFVVAKVFGKGFRKDLQDFMQELLPLKPVIVFYQIAF